MCDISSMSLLFFFCLYLYVCLIFIGLERLNFPIFVVGVICTFTTTYNDVISKE